MTTATSNPVLRAATARRWPVHVGRILSGLAAAMLALSAAMKLSHAAGFVATFTEHFGYPETALTPIGVLELGLTVLYLVPKTARIGALLLTAYLGGAVATHVRVGDPFLIPIVLGFVLWAGLVLRDAPLRLLLPKASV
jgi:hypothetical protein